MSGGTTGTPKGVTGTHRGMVVAGLQLQAWLRPAMNEWTDKIMLPLPLFHTYGNTGVQSLAFINHNPIALIPNPRDLRDLLHEINKVKPAFICTVPTLLNGPLWALSTDAVRRFGMAARALARRLLGEEIPPPPLLHYYS